MSLRRTQKESIKASKGRGRGRGKGGGRGKKSRKGSAEPKAKSKAKAVKQGPSCSSQKGNAKPKAKAQAKARGKAGKPKAPPGVNLPEGQRLGCPTCRWSQGGCHICRRPGHKCRTPRPDWAN